MLGQPRTESPGFQVPHCRCGHAIGDHRSNGAGWPHPLRYGVCLRTGCTCVEFVPADSETKAAA